MKKSIIISIICLIPLLAYGQGKDVAVTVYNSDVALVKDVRPMNLAEGISTISFTDVAVHIDPTSVSFASKSDPDGVRILEQNYEYDIVNAAKMLQKYVDAKVKISLKDAKPVEGTLLSSTGSNVLLRLKNGEIFMV